MIIVNLHKGMDMLGNYFHIDILHSNNIKSSFIKIPLIFYIIKDFSPCVCLCIGKKVPLRFNLIFGRHSVGINFLKRNSRVNCMMKNSLRIE